jgi:hypothetical protein
LTFQESSNLVVLVFGHRRKRLLSGFKVTSEDKRLVLNNCQRQGERNHVDILVGDINPGITG